MDSTLGKKTGESICGVHGIQRVKLGPLPRFSAHILKRENDSHNMACQQMAYYII